MRPPSFSSNFLRYRPSYRYEGQQHSSQSYVVIFLALIVSAIDLISGMSRLINYMKGVRSGDKFSVLSFWRTVILGQDETRVGLDAEYTNLVVDEPEDMEDLKLRVDEGAGSHHVTHDLEDHNETAQWANDVHRHRDFPETPVSERTLFGPRSHRGSQHSDDNFQEYALNAVKVPLVRRVGRIAFATLERSLVFAGFGQLLFGIVVYTGGCRENYINGCLAHLISESMIMMIFMSRY